jgi:hypothetical protein
MWNVFAVERGTGVGTCSVRFGRERDTFQFCLTGERAGVVLGIFTGSVQSQQLKPDFLKKIQQQDE